MYRNKDVVAVESRRCREELLRRAQRLAAYASRLVKDLEDGRAHDGRNAVELAREVERSDAALYACEHLADRLMESNGHGSAS